MDDLTNKINAYFDNVTDEDFTKALIKAGFDVRCKQHPKYQIKRRPTSNCVTCVQIWTAKVSKEES